MLRSIVQLKKMDWMLFGSVLLLVGFGLSVIYSTSLGAGQDGPVADFGNVWEQDAFAAAGTVPAVAISMPAHRAIAGSSPLLSGAVVALLVSVLFLGETIRGTTG